MRVLMYPLLSRIDNTGENGIKRVVEAYYKYAPAHGIEFVECSVDDENAYEVFACHAGSTNRYPINRPTVSHLHGLYWTADYRAALWEWKANNLVIESCRRATEITVPSKWVAESIARDMRVYPHILPHGIEWEKWVHSYVPGNYVLWNKNRNVDVCDPSAIGWLAQHFEDITFTTTFAPLNVSHPNINVIGLQPHETMKTYIQKALVYLSTTKETFGIGILEALASGVPVLGYAHGGNKDIVQHGVDGYLARPGDLEDLARGLRYCINYRATLSDNAKINVRRFQWDRVAQYLAEVYGTAWEKHRYNQRKMQIPESMYLIS